MAQEIGAAVIGLVSWELKRVALALETHNRSPRS